MAIREHWTAQPVSLAPNITEFADLTGGLCVRLVGLLPAPCHSNYSAIELYWAGLEGSWNGLRKMAFFVETIYANGRQTMRLLLEKDIEQRLERFDELNYWDIATQSKPVLLQFPIRLETIHK